MLATAQLETSGNLYEIENAQKLFSQRCLIVGLFSMKEKKIETHLTKCKVTN